MLFMSSVFWTILSQVCWKESQHWLWFSQSTNPRTQVSQSHFLHKVAGKRKDLLTQSMSCPGSSRAS